MFPPNLIWLRARAGDCSGCLAPYDMYYLKYQEGEMMLVVLLEC
jgi:hypothetical protein